MQRAMSENAFGLTLDHSLVGFQKSAGVRTMIRTNWALEKRASHLGMSILALSQPH